MHTPTLFLVMVAVSLVLAASIALVGHRDHSERYYWAGGLTAQALAYVLFGLRGQMPDWPSIVLGNVLLASSFGLYTTGLMRFRGVRLPRWLVWGPVAITGLLFWVLIQQTTARLTVGAVLIMVQIGILLTALLIRRQTPLLRGEWLIVSGAMAMAGLMAFRLWAVTSGLLRIQFVTDGGWIQGMTFMFAMTSTLMLAIGLIIMSEERAEASLALGQRFQWYRGQILERLSTGAPLAEVLDAIRQGLEALRPDTQCRIALGDQESGMPPKADDTPWKTSWSQPVVSSTGKVLGHFMLYQEDPRPPTPEDLSLIRQSAMLVALALDQDALARQRQEADALMHSQAFHDGLTQLPNRRLLQNNLNMALAAQRRQGTCGGLMFMDLDNFKPLNDTHGHDVGDRLLVEVAKRLTRQVRETDTVARFGGDEFVVLLADLGADMPLAQAQAQKIAEKVLEALGQPYELGTVTHRCTASIGLVVFQGGAIKAEHLIKEADAAMYAAKQQGRNRVHRIMLEPKPV